MHLENVEIRSGRLKPGIKLEKDAKNNKKVFFNYVENKKNREKNQYTNG